MPRPGIQAQRPAPAPHASHARHDRSMARWISVARAKVGGLDCSPRSSRNDAPSSGCPFVHFELGITMVLRWTCPNRLTKIRVWRIFVHLSKEIYWFSSPQAAECLSHLIKRLFFFSVFSSICTSGFISGYRSILIGPNTKSTKTCSQRFEIEHFCPGKF